MLKKLLLGITFLCSLALVQPTLAQTFGKDADTPTRLINPIGGTEQNPTGTVDTRIIFGKAIKVTLGFLGTFTLAVFVYGGFLWLTSAGNSEKVQKGAQGMLYAVVGLFIIFGAYGILNTIIEGIRGDTSNNRSNITAGQATVSDETPCTALGTRDQCSQNPSCTFAMFEGYDPECVSIDEKPQKCREWFEQCNQESDSEEDVALPIVCDTIYDECLNTN